MDVAVHHSLDLHEIPLTALKHSTLVSLSASLNQLKIIPSNNGLQRDWRGLAQLMGLNGVETKQISIKPDCFSALMDHWGTKGNIFLFQEYLMTIDRYDVLDDTKDAMFKDSLDYKERLNKLNITDTSISIEADKRILTVDDVLRLDKGLEPQIYDAYVLYAEEDVDFATQIIETMEQKYNFKLCVRDRDLIGGVQFEHDAITKLIAERCRRLIVVVSSNFLKSKANKFFLTFAQALGIDIRERKVIPILYEPCDVPPELSYFFLLDYNRAGRLWNFWEKLRDSIQVPEVSQYCSKSNHVSVVREKPKNNLWISRTRFETDHDESELKKSQTSLNGSKPKKKNIYKMLKDSFKVKKSLDCEESSDSKFVSESSVRLLDSCDDVPLENFNHCSSFESKHMNLNATEKSKKSKIKLYKKRAVETLLS